MSCTQQDGSHTTNICWGPIAIIICGICTFYFVYIFKSILKVKLHSSCREENNESVITSWPTTMSWSLTMKFLVTKYLDIILCFFQWPGYFLYFLLATVKQSVSRGGVVCWWLTLKAFGPRDPTTSSFKGVTDHPPAAAADPEAEQCFWIQIFHTCKYFCSRHNKLESCSYNISNF